MTRTTKPKLRTNDFKIPGYLEMMMRHAPACNRGELDGTLAFSQIDYLTTRDVPKSFRVDPGYGKKGEKARLENDLATAFGMPKGSVFLASSAMQAELDLMRALVAPGDEVVLEDPTYDPMIAQLQSCGARIRKLPRRWSNQFRLDLDRLESLLSRKTKLIVLTNGHNPSGMNLTGDELAGLARLAESRRVPVLLDEVYLPATPGADSWEYSCRRSPWLFSVGSLDKSFRLGPLRLGWVVGDPAVVPGLGKQRLLAPSLAAPSLQLLDHFLPKLETLRRHSMRVNTRGQKILQAWIDSRDDVDWVRPTGGNIGFPRLPVSGDAVADRLLRRHKILVPSGSWFGHPRHLRIAYVTAPSRLKTNLAIMGEVIDRLKTPGTRSR